MDLVKFARGERATGNVTAAKSTLWVLDLASSREFIAEAVDDGQVVGDRQRVPVFALSCRAHYERRSNFFAFAGFLDRVQDARFAAIAHGQRLSVGCSFRFTFSGYSKFCTRTGRSFNKNARLRIIIFAQIGPRIHGSDRVQIRFCFGCLYKINMTLQLSSRRKNKRTTKPKNPPRVTNANGNKKKKCRQKGLQVFFGHFPTIKSLTTFFYFSALFCFKFFECYFDPVFFQNLFHADCFLITWSPVFTPLFFLHRRLVAFFFRVSAQLQDRQGCSNVGATDVCFRFT